MTLYKTSTTDSKIIVSSSVYLCECGYTEIIKENDEIDIENLCPECGEKMEIVSSSTECKDEEKPDSEESDG